MYGTWKSARLRGSRLIALINAAHAAHNGAAIEGIEEALDLLWPEGWGYDWDPQGDPSHMVKDLLLREF